MSKTHSPGKIFQETLIKYLRKCFSELSGVMCVVDKMINRKLEVADVPKFQFILTYRQNSEVGQMME